MDDNQAAPEDIDLRLILALLQSLRANLRREGRTLWREGRRLGTAIRIHKCKWTIQPDQAPSSDENDDENCFGHSAQKYTPI